jgi:hypothetical protein
MRHSKLLVSVSLIVGVFGIARTASAQFPFQLVVQNGASTTVVGNGANISVAANGVGQTQQVIITITYTGTGSASLDPAQLFGSPAFSPGRSRDSHSGTVDGLHCFVYADLGRAGLSQFEHRVQSDGREQRDERFRLVEPQRHVSQFCPWIRYSTPGECGGIK